MTSTFRTSNQAVAIAEHYPAMHLIGKNIAAIAPGKSGVATSYVGVERRAPLRISDAVNLTAEDTGRFLRIVEGALLIKRHFDLFLFLQGEIQHFIPHQILISGWGNRDSSDLTLNVISALPGVRTQEAYRCDVGSMLKDLMARWIDNGRRPMLLANAADEPLAPSSCDCAMHKAIREMRSILVHGIYDERDGVISLYVALNQDSIVGGRNVEHFPFLIDALIAQIDGAHRKVSALQSSASVFVNNIASPGSIDLSAREVEIIKWVAEGKTNVEIAKILNISSFTVKNHVQRIFRKIGATNRTEAVARYRKQGL